MSNLSPAITIIREVCDRHGISPQDLKGKRRLSDYADARKECALRLKNLGLSYSAIGRLLCKDHTSIMYYLGARKEAGEPRTRNYLVRLSPSAIATLAGSTKEILGRIS